MDSIRYLLIREAITIEKSSKNNSIQGSSYNGDRGSYLWAPDN